jgi:VRR-NUC domain
VIELTTSTLAYPAESLTAWQRGPDMLEGARVDEDLVSILTNKRKARPGSRFFGEAFVATKLRHTRAFYGSFQWLTTPRFLTDDPFAPSPTAAFKEKYRRALHDYFGGQLATMQENAQRLRDRTGVKPAAPDLWLIVQPNRHRFIEVKLPRDSVRDNQLAGLAVIAVSLRKTKDSVAVEVIELFVEGQSPPRKNATTTERFRYFGREITGS